MGFETVKVVLFDFDGTIVDSIEAGVAITNRVAVEMKLPPIDKETLERLKQAGSREALKQLKIPIFKLPLLIRRLSQELNREIPNLKLFPQIREMLFDLKQQNCKLGIVSTNSAKNIRDFLDIQELNETFDFISATYSVFGKSRLIRRIVRENRFNPAHVYYVGDETRDIEAARKSGVRSIAVTWGLNSPEILAHYNPDAVIHQPKDLVTFIRNYEL